VAIITFNEEKNIQGCLESVEEIAQEIIVLDSFSTDRTKEIAEMFSKVKFSTNSFRGHVEQKNKAISLCENDWILSLDADERLSPELRQSLKNWLEMEVDSTLSGYQMARLTWHMGRWIRHSGWYPQRRLRLIKKGKAQWTGDNPHDYLELAKGEVYGRLSGDILHYSFQDLSHQIQTINQFSSIVAFTRFKRGQEHSLLLALTKPFIKFIEIYIWKLGFLDGIPGLYIALSSSFSTFLKYAKIYELKFIQRPSNLRSDYGNK